MFKIIVFMNPRAMPNAMILVGFTNVSRRPELKESLWETMFVCLFEIRQKYQCLLMTICTVHMQVHNPNGRRTNDLGMEW